MRNRIVINKIRNKKIIFLFFSVYVLLLFWGCSSENKNKEDLNIESSEIESNHLSSKTLPFKKVDWIDTYYEIVKRREGMHILLTDINFDGIPELFFTQQGTSNTWLNHGYSFDGEKILDIKFSDEFIIPTNFELFQDKKNNDIIWIANGMFRVDAGVYCYVWYKIDFQDFSNVKVSLLFGWREVLVGEGESGKLTYQLLEEDGTCYDMNREEIENYKKEVFSNYKHLDNLTMFSFVEEFADESEKEIDKDLFYSFAQLYDTIKEENSCQNKSNSLQVPISGIYNENLYNDYQTHSIPISLVQMEYIRHDEINEANICVQYTQLSRFLDPNIQLEINTKIKEYAFSQWNVKTDREMELNILQNSFIYKNYLSVRNSTDYYSKTAVHPWQALSAMIFDLRTGNEVSLRDIIKVDDRLKEKIYAGDFEVSRTTHEQCIEMGYYDDLWNSILKNSKSLDKSQYFYLLDNKLGFILEVPHAIGDYITFEESLQDLEDLLQN